MNGESTGTKNATWAEWCPWTRLLRAGTLAYNVNQLLLSLAAIALFVAGGMALDGMWREDARVIVELKEGLVARSELTEFAAAGCNFAAAAEFASQQKAARGGAPGRLGVFGETSRYLRNLANQGSDAILSFRLIGSGERPGLTTVIYGLAALPIWLVGSHLGFAFAFGLWCLAVFALFGGAVHRIAAVQAAREESLGLIDAFDFARRKWLSFFAAPLMPPAILLFVGVLLFVGGLIARAPVLDVLAGLIWIVPLLAGLIMAIFGLASLGVWPLMAPAIATEGTDAFDAFSRGVGYTFERRWRTPFYYLVSMVYGLVCIEVVELLARMMFWMTHHAVGLGMGLIGYQPTGAAAPINKLDALWQAPVWGRHFWGGFAHQPLEGTAWAASGLIYTWTVVFVLLVAAYAFSLYCSSATLIYQLLRHDVDGTELDSVWTEDDEVDNFDEPAGPAKAEGAAAAGEKPA